jgi:hypothetical protein
MYHYRFDHLFLKYKVSIYKDDQFIKKCHIAHCVKDLPSEEWVRFNNRELCKEYAEKYKNKVVSKEVLQQLKIIE